MRMAPFSPKRLTRLDVEDSRDVRKRMTSWIKVGKGRRRRGRGGRWKIAREDRETKTKAWYTSCHNLSADVSPRGSSYGHGVAHG